MTGSVNAKPEQERAATLIEGIERAVDRAVVAALDRHLPHLADHLADEVAERVLDRPGERRPVDRLIHDQFYQQYPARDAADWIEARYDRKGCPAGVRGRLWAWREGRTTWARRSTIEEIIRTLGGVPADLPDELPALDAEEVEAT